jgi:hypothetical protein
LTPGECSGRGDGARGGIGPFQRVDQRLPIRRGAGFLRNGLVWTRPQWLGGNPGSGRHCAAIDQRLAVQPTLNIHFGNQRTPNAALAGRALIGPSNLIAFKYGPKYILSGREKRVDDQRTFA